MKNKFLTSLRALTLLLVMCLSIGNVWGAITSPYTGTPSGSVTSSGGDITMSSVKWSYGSANYLAISTNQFQIGSSKKPQTSGWTISTDISNFGSNVTITGVTIAAYTGSKGSYDITVGGTSQKSGSLTTSSSTYSTSTLAVTSGNIDITITGTEKAAYLGTITVTFTTGGGSDPSLSLSPTSIDFGSVEKGKSVDAKSVTATLTNTTYAAATLSGDNADAFEITAGEELAETGTITVQPKSTTLQTAGTYSASLDVEADGVSGTKSATISLTVTEPAAPTGIFTKYTGASLVEGDYVICDGTNAMNNVVTNKRLMYATVTVSSNQIENPDAAVIWHIAPSSTEGYWTMYNNASTSYAAFTSSNGNAALITTLTDYGLWQFSDGEFTNKGKTEKYLRKNGTYGFASYGSSTGNKLTLYAKLASYAVSKAGDIANGDVDAQVSSASVIGQNVSVGTTVALSNTPASGYTCTGYSVYKTGDQSTTVTVTDGKFTMPAYAVTVSATFAVGIATPELDLASGTYDGEQLALVSNYDDDYMYFYTNDGTDPAADGNLDPTGTSKTYDKDEGITISSSSTIKVVAYDLEGNHSAISTYTYTINPVYTSIAQFKTDQPENACKVSFTEASNVVVTAVSGKNVYVQDASGNSIILYFSANSSWTVGKKVTGYFYAKYATYLNMPEMSITNNGDVAATIDGTLPAATEITDLSASNLEPKLTLFVKAKSVYFQSQSLSSKSVIVKDASENPVTLYDKSEIFGSKNLPLTATASDVTGVLIKYSSLYELLPANADAISTNGAEAQVNIDPIGGATAETAEPLALNAEVTITPVTGFATTYNTAAITEVTKVAITGNTTIAVEASRDFYTTKSVTYYYKVDESSKAITVNQPEVGGTIAADPISASAGATITLTHSAAPHYTFGSFTVLDASSNPVTVNENEGVYTFEMPNSDVTVTGTFIENAKATATFAKGEPSATGDAPADIEWYVGENITLPANTFSFTGHKFAGWSDGANVYAAGASYEMPEGGKAFTATWEALSVWATTYTSNVTVGSDKVRFTTEGTQYDAKKAGTSGSAGSTTVTVPVGATALHFHAAGWSAEDVTLQVSKGGVAIQSFALPRDAGMNNNSPFTLANDPAQTEYFMVALSDITEETVITFAATAGKRFAIYGVNAVFPPAITLDPASKAFGEVKVGANAEQVFTITPNAFVTGTLEAELTGTDADQFAVGTISDNQVTVTFQPDKVNASVSANLRVKSMVSSVEEAYVEAALTGVAISAETPEISLDKEVVDFGVVSQGASVAAQTVAATLTYLSEANVAVTGTAFSVSPATLTASGDITITPNTANVGVYEETLTVSGTGATAKQVTVRMTVASKWATTYTSNVSFTATNTVGVAPNTYSAIKGGASKAAGTLNITFPAGVTDIHFHAVGWKGESVTLKVKNGSTELLSAALTNDEHVTGTDENFAIEADLSTFYYTIHLTNALEEATAITFTSEGSTNYRFVLFGINQEGGPEITSISISGEATKLTYIEGEEFDPAGLTVMANYNIGDPQDVTSNSTFTFDPALLSAGQTSVSVTAHFQEFNSAPLVVNGLTVSAITLESIKLSGNYQTTFHAGDAFNHDNLVVTAIYSNEDEEDVTDDAVVSNPDMSTAGKKTVTVTYGGKEATYGIVVLATTIVFYESFDTNDGTGGNDGQWSGSIASNAITSDNEGWTFTNAKGANKCAKFGSGSNLGSAKTPEITGTGDFVITFKAGAWDGNSENLNLVISTTNGTLSQEAVVLEKAKWNNYSIALTGVTENFQITIAAAQASNNRFFLDEVMVQKAYVRSLSSSNIGTVCVDKATSIENYSGATFYEILNKDADEKNVYFQEVVELEAGMPYIFQPSANILILPYASEETATAQSKNGLYGWLSDNYEFSSQIDSKDVYFVSGGKIVRCGNQCTILKNRAYIVLSEISGQGSEAPGRRRLVLGVEGKGVATGMEEAIIMSDGELKKVVIDGQFYILRDGKVFDAQGKLVK